MVTGGGGIKSAVCLSGMHLLWKRWMDLAEILHRGRGPTQTSHILVAIAPGIPPVEMYRGRDIVINLLKQIAVNPPEVINYSVTKNFLR